MGLFTDRDILKTSRAEARRLMEARPNDTGLVIVVGPDGRVKKELYQVGHQAELGVGQALDLLNKPGIRIRAEEKK